MLDLIFSNIVQYTSIFLIKLKTFNEEHQGQSQETLFRQVSKHQTALERQVMESIRIEEVSAKEEESLNLKSEWAGSKLPNLQVSRPKGTSGQQERREGAKRYRTAETGKEETQETPLGNEGAETRKRAKLEGQENAEDREKPLVRSRIIIKQEEQTVEERRNLEKARTFTQLKLKEILRKGQLWSPGSGRKKSQETVPERGKQRSKRKRSDSQTPPKNPRHSPQEKNVALTPTLKKKRPGNRNEIGRSQEKEEIPPGELTPIRKLIKKKKLVTTKVRKLQGKGEK